MIVMVVAARTSATRNSSVRVVWNQGYRRGSSKRLATAASRARATQPAAHSPATRRWPARAAASARENPRCTSTIPASPTSTSTAEIR